MADPTLPIRMTAGIPYNATLGQFHNNWSAIDLYTDYAIYKFLNVTALQAHLITSGMMFGRKARLLGDLIKHSDDPRKILILRAFSKIRKANRDIIAHSYVRSDAISVTFLERSISGDFRTTEHTFISDEFRAHVLYIADAAIEFYDALDIVSEELDAFVNAALSFKRKSNKLPGNPTDIK